MSVFPLGGHTALRKGRKAPRNPNRLRGENIFIVNFFCPSSRTARRETSASRCESPPGCRIVCGKDGSIPVHREFRIDGQKDGFFRQAGEFNRVFTACARSQARRFAHIAPGARNVPRSNGRVDLAPAAARV